MEKILVLEPFPEDDRRRIEAAAPACEVVFCDQNTERTAYLAHMEDAAAIIGDPKPEDLRLCRQLRWMQSTWAGVEHYIPLLPADAELCNMSGGYGPVIAEYEIGAVLALCCRLPAYFENKQARRWQCAGFRKPLEGSTVLIVGAGDIGSSLAVRLRPLVGKIIGVRRTARSGCEAFDEIVLQDELDRVLPQADIVCCSVPQTAQTARMFDEARLRRMKRDAIFVNVGRGSLVDLDALCRVMDEGHLWGAAIDVTQPEPLPAEHPLWRQPRVILTPHVSGNAFGPDSPTQRRIWDFAVQNFVRWRTGQPRQNVVDRKTGYRSGKPE